MRRKGHVWLWSVEGWNGLVDFYFRHRLKSALHLRAPGWRHPWFTTLRWDAGEEVWLAAIKPGACPTPGADGDPVVRVDQVHAPPEMLERLGLPSGGDGRRLRGYLSEGAPLALPPDRWRSIGTDAVAMGATAEAVPTRFAEMGVMGPTVLRETGGGLVRSVAGLSLERRRARLLRACDIVLECERAAVTPRLAESGSVPGEGALEFGLSRSAAYDAEPQVVAIPQWAPPAEIELLDLGMGIAQDDGRDAIHLATVYLVSPRGTEEGAVPDERWQPYVEHRVHWNLQYVTRHEERAVEPTRVDLAVPMLGMGTLGQLAAPVVSAINDKAAEVEEALREVRSVGRFLAF